MFVVITDNGATISAIGPFDTAQGAADFARTVPAVHGPIVAEVESPDEWSEE